MIDTSPEDIDLAVRYGFGFRYVVCGPVRQRDLNGLVINRRPPYGSLAGIQ